MIAASLQTSERAVTSATRYVRSARLPLVAAVLLRAALAGIATVVVLLFVLALVDLLHPLSLGARFVMRDLAVGLGVATSLAFVWRDRRVFSLERVALWLEEHLPSLDFALVTALELESRGEATAVDERWPESRSVILGRVARAIAIPSVVAVIAWASAALLPASALTRASNPRPGDALVGAGNAPTSASRLTPLVATILPPTYSRLARAVVDEPAIVTALAGSDVVLEGRGAAVGISASLGTAAVPPSASEDRWSVRFRMPVKPAVVRLRDRSFERLIALEPRVDASPVVVLTHPDRDSVLRAPSGTVNLEGRATDDFGLATANFEIIVSSGEGETFTFRTLTLGAVRPEGDSAAIAAPLTLERLGLEPGDLLHIRAVARDRNDATGPGIGASETRTLRIARAGEYDSVAVESAAPPPEEQSIVSQRMLIMLTEVLERRRPRLSRNTVLDEASHISADQKRLRRSVAEVIFARLGEPTGEETKEDETHERLTPDELLKRADAATERLSGTGALDFEGGEAPVVAVNRPLLEAYRAMWDASMSLDQGEPGRALPPMRIALAAIERARQAERIYLRGRPPAVVVDIAKVRLAGTEPSSPAARTPRAPLDSARAALEQRFTHAIDLLASQPAVASDSLMLLRIDALVTEPRFGAALNDLVTALRRGRGDELPRLTALARRALAGAPRTRDGLGAWSVAP